MGTWRLKTARTQLKLWQNDATARDLTIAVNVSDISANAKDAAIVKTIVLMSETPGLNVIAKGVETQAQRDFLDMHGCHCFQGYLFGILLPINEFESRLKRRLLFGVSVR
jgi:EAL domain-containing protein (putative c-di-GMP-specific phosphodiesterase class I)